MLDVKLPNLKRLEKKYVLEYEKDEIEKGLIMFYGDSSFTRWKPASGHRALGDDIRMKDGSKAAINHGFGTSTAEEQLYYYNRLVRPWEPRALVVQTHGNDTDLNYSPEEIIFLQSRLLEYARNDMPGIKFYLCDTRPLQKTMNDKYTFYYHAIQYNELLKDYCAKHDDCTYVCHTDSPLFYNDPADVGTYDKIRTDIFVEDQIHYNQKGYDLYKKFFLEALDDIL
jgi:hypothetical protein